MLKEKRIIQINNMLKENGQIKISELCKIFNVTEMTIRRDLDNIINDNQGVIRIHGGAMLSDKDALTELPFEMRINTNIESKEKIALKALEYLSSGQTVFFDSGTTAQLMTSKLDNSLRIVALTNAIHTAYELLARPNVTVMMIGGELRRNTLSCRGTVSEEAIEQFRVNIAFLGLNAIDENGDLFIANATESGFKKKVMKISDATFILADSTKLNKNSFCKFANISEINGIIVDSGITQDQYENLIGLGANVIIA